MKKLEKVLHIINITLTIMMSVHLMGGWILSWLFDALFFDAVWYVMLLCFTYGLERCVQVATADSVRDRIMTVVSALLLTAAGTHLLLAGILRPIEYHNIDELLCTACMMDAIKWYILPCLIWAIVRLAVTCLAAPKGHILVPAVYLGSFIAWFGYTLFRWVEGIGRHGPGFYVSGGYYAGRVFIPVLMLFTVTAFLVRNVRETLREVRE